MTRTTSAGATTAGVLSNKSREQLDAESAFAKLSPYQKQVASARINALNAGRNIVTWADVLNVIRKVAKTTPATPPVASAKPTATKFEELSPYQQAVAAARINKLKAGRNIVTEQDIKNIIRDVAQNVPANP